MYLTRVRGINETLLTNCRKFYTAYPQIYAYLTGEISATPSHKFVEISPTSSDKLKEKSATISHQFITTPEQLISQSSCSQRLIICEKILTK